LCWVTAVLAVSAGKTKKVELGSSESHHLPIEAHHSLSQPLDQAMVYWRFGGATVVTKNQIRLVPATQSRAGWLWNDFPIEKKDWEVELELNVFSKPHFGGDGFAFWILTKDLDPSFNFEPDYLNGPIFGMRDNFQGFGVMFDTYDNDAKRDNPAVFVIENYEGTFRADHDQDFTNSMISKHEGGFPFKCFANYRNTKENYKVLIRYQNGLLHVYVQETFVSKKPGSNYKLCLVVRPNVPETVRPNHFAMTAMTGSVADVVDVMYISTRYLDDTDAEVDDSALDQSSGYASSSSGKIFWLVIFGGGCLLVFWTVRDLLLMSRLKSSQTNPVYLASELNSSIPSHIAVHAILSIILLLSGSFLGFLFNLPVLAFRGYSYVNQTHLVDPAVLSGGGRGIQKGLTYQAKNTAMLAVYIICTIYYFVKFILA